MASTTNYFISLIKHILYQITTVYIQLQRTVKGADLQDFLCMYQTQVIYKVPLCATRTDPNYLPLTLQ